jgi:uncharacterized protein (TIGR03437 family)
MPAGPAPVLHAVSSLATLPLRFEENLGQTDAEVRFLARGRAYTFFLTQDEAVLALRSESRRTSSDTRPRVLRMKLVGAERQAELRGEDTLASSSHYFRGNDPARWRTGVHHYKRVRRQAVYPGIDVVYYGAHGSLEYDFEVSPGADPRRIELQFHGQDSLSIDEAGDLVFQLDSQPLRYEKPLIYQSYGEERVIIAGRYEPRGAGRVGFELAADYDPSRPLIIDPVLNYSTFLGDTDDEQGNSIAVGPDGSAYIVGATQSSRFPTTTGSAQPAFGGPEDDVFVAKLNPLGTGLVFSTFLGDDENDRGRGVAVGSDGSVYVVGETESGEFPTTAGAWQPEFARGGRDGFVAKISPDGSRLVYSTFLGSDQDDWATGVAVDTQGQAHVIGGTRSSKFPTTPLSLQRQLGGGSDAFIVKIMPDGSGPVFSTFLGGGSDDEGLAIAVDLFSTIYATGYTQSNSFPVTADAFQPERDSDEDAFVVKIFGQGTVLARSSFFGGNSSDFGNAIAIDSVGAVYICGFTRSNDLPKGPTVFQNEYNGGGDAFVVKVVEAPRFQIAHMTYLGTGEEDTSNGIVVSDDGSVTVAGHTKSAGFPVTDGAVQSEFGGGDGDAFVATLDPLFRRLTFSTFLGGEGRDEARGIARGGDGSFFVTGLTRSASFPIAAGAAQPAKSDGDDVFAVKISEALTLTSVSAASYLPGGPVAPNSIASAFSHDLAPGAEQAAALPLPSELLGVQASVIDSTGFSRSAALFFVSPQQINFLVPEGTALGTATVEISRGGEVIARGTVTVEAVAPALFSINSSGEGVAAGVLIVERADGSRTTQRIFDPDQFPPNIQPIPVNIGTAADQAVLLLFGTGIRGAGGAANVSVEIGGEQQMVAYAGDQLQYAGLDQVNVPLSPSLAGRGLINIRLSAGGRVTNTVTIRVQ